MFKKASVAGITGSTVFGSYFLYDSYKQKEERKNIVLIGCGYAGRTFYNNIDKSKFDVKVILNGHPTVLQPYFLDSLETNSRSNIVHKIDNSKKDFITCDVIKSIDTNSNIIVASTDNDVENKYNYDYLVMAIGHETNTFNIEGVDSNCNFYTSYQDLEKLRNISNVKKLKIAVIGASLAGLEIAGFLSDDHQIDVIEYANTILPTMKKTTQSAVYDLLQSKHKINFKLETRLLKVEKNNLNDKKIVHTDVFGIINNDEYDIVIWTAGVKSNSNMDRWLNTNKVDEYLKLEKQTNVYAIGDCNNTMPKSGQSAKLQGKYLANLFNSNFDKNEKYVYESLGIVIKLPNCVYIENNYYSGFAPRFVHDIIHYLNI